MSYIMVAGIIWHSLTGFCILLNLITFILARFYKSHIPNVVCRILWMSGTFWHFWYKCVPWKIEEWKKYHRSIKRMAPRSSVLHLCGVLEQCKGWCLTLSCVCQWNLQIGVSVESIFLGTWRCTRWELLLYFKHSVHQFGLRRITGSPTCNLSRLIYSHAMSNISEDKDITSYISEEDFLLDFCPSSNGIWCSCWWLSMEWKKHSCWKY